MFDVNKSRPFWMIGIIVGALLILAPAFGLLGTAFGMAHAFWLLHTSGVGQPDALSADIGGVLTSTAIGILLCPIGIILFALSLIFYLRARNASH